MEVVHVCLYIYLTWRKYRGFYQQRSFPTHNLDPHLSDKNNNPYSFEENVYLSRHPPINIALTEIKQWK